MQLVGSPVPAMVGPSVGLGCGVWGVGFKGNFKGAFQRQFQGRHSPNSTWRCQLGQWGKEHDLHTHLVVAGCWWASPTKLGQELERRCGTWRWVLRGGGVGGVL